MQDGRKFFNQIAQDCGEQKSTISKRIRLMKEKGIIVGATTQLDYAALGYCAVGTINFKISPAQIDYAITAIKNIPDIYMASKSYTNFSVDVVATLKNMATFNRIKEWILRMPTVRDLETNIWTAIKNIPENLQILDTDKNEKIPLLKRNSDQFVEIDELDRKIIDELSNDGRLPFAVIANRLGVATNTVIRKYERLKSNGVVKVSIQICPKELGYRGSATFNLSFSSQESLESISERLSNIPNIILLIKTSGRYDLRVVSLLKDLDQLINLQIEISKTAEISKSQLFVGPVRPILPGPKTYISTF